MGGMGGGGERGEGGLAVRGESSRGAHLVRPDFVVNFLDSDLSGSHIATLWETTHAASAQRTLNHHP